MSRGHLGKVRRSGIRISVLLLAFFTSLGLSMAAATEKESPQVVKCDVHHGACTALLAGREIRLDITPKPVRAMTDLTFSVAISGPKLSTSPYIDLGMPGMDMGPNRVQLTPLEGSMYQGNGIIVRCPSGRKAWKARLTIPELGRAEFLFDVIY